METATTPESLEWNSNAAGFAADSPHIWDSGAQENTYEFVSVDDRETVRTLVCPGPTGTNVTFSGSMYTVSRSAASTFDPPNAGRYDSSDVTGVFV